MKIKLNKTYKNRLGKKVKIVRTTSDLVYQFEGSNWHLIQIRESIG